MLLACFLHVSQLTRLKVVLFDIPRVVGRAVHGKARGHGTVSPRYGCSLLMSVEFIEGLELVHAGSTAPVSEITLRSERDDVRIRSGSGMLLRVIGIGPE